MYDVSRLLYDYQTCCKRIKTLPDMSKRLLGFQTRSRLFLYYSSKFVHYFKLLLETFLGSSRFVRDFVRFFNVCWRLHKTRLIRMGLKFIWDSHQNWGVQKSTRFSMHKIRYFFECTCQVEKVTNSSGSIVGTYFKCSPGFENSGIPIFPISNANSSNPGRTLGSASNKRSLLLRIS